MDRGSWIVDCGLWIVDCGWRILRQAVREDSGLPSRKLTFGNPPQSNALSGDRTRHRVLFAAPTPETRLAPAESLEPRANRGNNIEPHIIPHPPRSETQVHLLSSVFPPPSCRKKARTPIPASFYRREGIKEERRRNSESSFQGCKSITKPKSSSSPQYSLLPLVEKKPATQSKLQSTGGKR